MRDVMKTKGRMGNSASVRGRERMSLLEEYIVFHRERPKPDLWGICP